MLQITTSIPFAVGVGVVLVVLGVTVATHTAGTSYEFPGLIAQGIATGSGGVYTGTVIRRRLLRRRLLPRRDGAR